MQLLRSKRREGTRDLCRVLPRSSRSSKLLVICQCRSHLGPNQLSYSFIIIALYVILTALGDTMSPFYLCLHWNLIIACVCFLVLAVLKLAVQGITLEEGGRMTLKRHLRTTIASLRRIPLAHIANFAHQSENCCIAALMLRL